MNRIKLISTLCALAFALCLPLTAWAQNPALQARITDLEKAVSALQNDGARITALETAVSTLKTDLDGAQSTITALQNGLAAANAQISGLQAALGPLAALAPFVRVDPGPINDLAGPHVIIKGANVHIRNGEPPLTTASINGLGNLLIGYNEAPSPDPENMVARNGSHNLIVGPYHRYGNSGGLVAGFANTIS